MAKNVIIVDSDPGFSVMLANALDSHPDFNASAVNSGRKAVATLQSNKDIDLVIVDMGLEDMPALKLVKGIRQMKPDMPIMIITLMGQDAPAEVKSLNLQGILPKPFFVGDLPKMVGQAVGLDLEAEEPDLPPPPPPAQTKKPAPRPRSEAPPPRSSSRRESPPPRPSSRSSSSRSRDSSSRRRDPAPPPPPPRRSSSRSSSSRGGSTPLESWKLEALQKDSQEIVEQLRNLNREIRAEVILLTAGTELIAKAGNMGDERAHELAILVAESAEATAQVADFLGERDGRFEQSLNEGSEFRLYSYSLGHGVVLSLALGMSVPLGILRHQTKRTGQSLMKYIQ